jgi:hypothetical protein
LETDMTSEREIVNARRQFLTKCGKLAIVTPPTVALLLSATNRNYATAASGGGNNGFGNGCCDGVPGNSGFTDTTR